MIKQHDGDCSIYASLSNIDMPEAGICVCGYGYQFTRDGDYSKMYSLEFQKKLIEENEDNSELVRKLLGGKHE